MSKTRADAVSIHATSPGLSVSPAGRGVPPGLTNNAIRAVTTSKRNGVTARFISKSFQKTGSIERPPSELARPTAACLIDDSRLKTLLCKQLAPCVGRLIASPRGGGMHDLRCTFGNSHAMRTFL